MKRIIRLLVLPVLIPICAAAQNTVTLNDLYRLAEANHPASRQPGLQKEASQMRSENLRAAYYPRLDMNASASWQSDVTEIPISLPYITIPEPPHDNYRVSLDVNQTIYDGGQTRNQQEMEKVNLSIDLANTEKDIVQVKERVNELFFSILLLQKKNGLLEVLKSDLGTKLTELKSAFENGVITQSDADVIRAEILRTEQIITENNYGIQATFNMLSLLVGKEINHNSLLQVTDLTSEPSNASINRPELMLFSLQRDKLASYKDLLKSKRLPRLGGYGQLGYGKPGLNMLSDKFDSYYLVGARLSWNIWDWKQVNKENRIADLNIQVLNLQKEAVMNNFRILAEKYRSEVKKYEALIISDEEIIRIKNRIAEVASSQLDNGIIRSSDYLREKNAALQAGINLEMHRILLLKAMTDYKAVLGVF